MKKYLLLAAAALLCCAAQAAHLSRCIPQAEIPVGLAALTDEAADTTLFLPGVAYCRHMPAGDQAGAYYMVLSLLNAETEVFPQMQLHFLVSDTMSIAGEEDILDIVGAIFYQSETAGGNAIQVDLSFEFLQFDTLADVVSAKYDIILLYGFQNHTPILAMYRGYVLFISNATNRLYVPEHESLPMALPILPSAAPQMRKVFRDGQLVILRGDDTYTLTGARLR